ncbi:MAG: DUF2520 domain-containing protein [Raineya sp.]
MQKISIIGSGRVAWHLAKIFYQKGFKLVEIYSRNPENARLLAQEVQAQVKQDLDFRLNPPDFLLISVSDNALAEVVQSICVAPHTLVAHTSGSMGMEIFEGLSYAFAVFYPLQTFSQNREVDFTKIPICLEATKEENYVCLEKIALQISHNVSRISSPQRKILHIAAVFACNFVNHLLAISKNILDEEGLAFDLLKPLVEETIAKALEATHPKDVQTGPAIRKDNLVMERHIAYLSSKPYEQEIYKILSENIMRIH